MDAESNTRSEDLKPKSWFGARHMQALLLFILVIIAYGMRVNLSVGIVAMTDPSINPDFPTYKWDDKDVVLSSFFWGYIIPQIGAGYFASKYGAKWFLAIPMIVCSILSILIPSMAELGSWGAMLCRALQGLCQGFFYPSIHAFLSKWIPLSERSRFGTFVYAGGPFGTVISMPVTGWISASSIGWPSVFYLYGALGLVWSVIWIFMGCDDPAKHKSIDPAEKKFIESQTKSKASDVPTPWLSIFKSLPFWAILVNHSGQNWIFFTLLTEIPSYLNNILNFDMKDNGLLSAVPYLAMWLLSLVFSPIADYLINRKILSIGATRKVFNSIGHYVPAITLIALGFSGKDQTLAIILLIASVSVNAATFCGYQVNHMDLSPTHAGSLMGLTNGLSNIFSIIAPLAVQYIVTGGPNEVDQWRIVFFLAAGICIVTNTFYVIFGSGNLQPWDSDAKKSEEEKSKDEQ